MRERYRVGYEDLEELRKRFAEFRSKHPPRTRFPEELWYAAAETARRRGVNSVWRCLRLDANCLRKWLGERTGETQPKRVLQGLLREGKDKSCVHGQKMALIDGLCHSIMPI